MRHSSVRLLFTAALLCTEVLWASGCLVADPDTCLRHSDCGSERTCSAGRCVKETSAPPSQPTDAGADGGDANAGDAHGGDAGDARDGADAMDHDGGIADATDEAAEADASLEDASDVEASYDDVMESGDGPDSGGD